MYPDSPEYLETLDAVRQRCQSVLAAARTNATSSITLNWSKLPAVADLVSQLIRRDYPDPRLVPPHSRWRHYQVDNIDRVGLLLDTWTKLGIDLREQTRRVLDLFVVSVLLDAGAGNDWKFIEASSGKTYARSEGLALAVLAMFSAGTFSSNSNNSYQVDGQALKNLKVAQLATGLQVSSTNPLVGLEGRCNLLSSLGGLMDSLEYYHGSPYSRPGNLVDYVMAHATDGGTVDLCHIWRAVQALKPMWPSRITLNGVALGDVWKSECLEPGSQLVPLHKLSQWLTYSVIEPVERVMKIRVTGKHKLTGLAEYRNGGLFMDMGVLQLTDEARKRAKMSDGPEPVPLFHADDAAVVEWRALTVALLDEIGIMVRDRLGVDEDDMELAKVLEGGTWKAGREVAGEMRPITRGPPMNLLSDGTVF